MTDKKELRSMLKDAGILFVITLISGLILGYVYELTKEPIRLQRERAIQEACQEVLEQAQSFSQIPYTPSESLTAELEEIGVTVGKTYEALDGQSSHLGYVVESSSSEGYGGQITLYVGVLADGTLGGVSILKMNETPGLGMNAKSVLVPQFAGKQESSFTFTKTGSASDSELDAISGATVTTKAVVDAVNGALKAISELTGESGKGGNANE